MGFVILTTQPHRCLDSLAFAEAFGVIAQAQTQDWGKLVLQRIWYQDGFEVKFDITQSDWAAQPWDVGTRQVIRDGAPILFERTGALLGLNERAQ